MKTLQIDEKNARKLYPSASAEFKATLEDTFGKEFFSQKITDRVKTFDDACEVLGINRLTFSDSDTPDEIAYKKIKIIVKALNEGWAPNWDNSSEYKYYPWFDMTKNGFSGVFSDRWFACTTVGSRLCFKNAELAKYAGTQFNSIYKDFFHI